MTKFFQPLFRPLFEPVLSPLVGKWGGATLQWDAVTGREVLAAIAGTMRGGRGDIAIIGDSNIFQLTSSGFSAEWELALSETFGVYGTGARGSGIETSWGSIRNGISGSDTPGTALTSAPTFFQDAALGAETSAFSRAVYKDTGNLTEPTNQLYQIVTTSILDPNKAINWHIRYGTFDSGSGVFRPTCRRLNTLTFEAMSASINTNTGVIGLADTVLNVPANPSRNVNLQFSFRAPTIDNVTGPFFASYSRFELAGVTQGGSLFPLWQAGGNSTYNTVVDFQAQNDDRWAEYFRSVTYLQNRTVPNQVLAVWLRHGGNDRNQTATSVGTYSGAVNAPSNTGPGIYDNTREIIEIMRAAWVASGRTVGNLRFIVGPYHPQAAFVTKLEEFEDAQAQLVTDYPGVVALIRGSMLTTPEEMTALGYYRSPVDDAHLTVTGYKAHARRDFALLSAA